MGSFMEAKQFNQKKNVKNCALEIALHSITFHGPLTGALSILKSLKHMEQSVQWEQSVVKDHSVQVIIK